MKVLFLTQWYPNRYDDMAGLFVRNHAEAVVRQGVDVCVLYCHPVEPHQLADLAGEEFQVVEQTTNGVREIYVYHSGSALTALLRGRDELFLRWGMPDICQLNVLSKTAFLAYEMFWRWKIPYVLVEHWSGYLPANGDFLRNNTPLKRKLYQHIARRAKCILPVSAQLKTAMQACGIRNNHWQLIHNVVYDCFFLPSERPALQPPYELLHVSCFDEKAKNVRGILNAIHLLLQQRRDFRLTLIGDGTDFLADKAYAGQLGLTPDHVRFVGEKTPAEVCTAMQHSHAFILFSRYENAPVVLSECMAVGLPVIATKVGGIPEMVNTHTGVLVPSEDWHALAAAITKMLDQLPAYHPATIRSFGDKYSYEKVGKQLLQLYESVLS